MDLSNDIHTIDNIERENEEDGYDTDYTSSYDSGGEVWTLEISHGKRFPYQPIELRGLYDCEDRRRPNGELSTAPTLTSGDASCHERHTARNEVREVRPEAIDRLWQATRQFYTATSPMHQEVGLSTGIAPLAEHGLKDKEEETEKLSKKRKKRSGECELEEYRYPRPAFVGTRNPKRVLNDMESSQVPCPLSPSATITFREALVATNKPRLICLSFPPFIVVHANLAYLDCTGFASNEVLGLPLHKCFAEDYQVDFTSSVTAMHDRLASIASKQSQGQEEATRCFMKVALVGPEAPERAAPEGNNDVCDDDCDTSSRGGDDTALFVTHYSVELEPVRNGQYIPVSAAGNIRRALVSPELSTFCGVLG